jgi:hypothetical protein
MDVRAIWGEIQTEMHLVKTSATTVLVVRGMSMGLRFKVKSRIFNGRRAFASQVRAGAAYLFRRVVAGASCDRGALPSWCQSRLAFGALLTLFFFFFVGLRQRRRRAKQRV